MKGIRSSSKSGLFLIELIIAIVFFSVASAICIQLFVKSYVINAHARDVAMASSLAQNEAERIKLGGAEYLDAEDGALFSYFYDEAGELLPAGTDEAAYTVTCEMGRESELLTATITVYVDDGAEEIYSLDVASHTGGTA